MSYLNLPVLLSFSYLFACTSACSTHAASDVKSKNSEAFVIVLCDFNYTNPMT